MLTCSLVRFDNLFVFERLPTHLTMFEFMSNQFIPFEKIWYVWGEKVKSRQTLDRKSSQINFDFRKPNPHLSSLALALQFFPTRSLLERLDSIRSRSFRNVWGFVIPQRFWLDAYWIEVGFLLLSFSLCHSYVLSFCEFIRVVLLFYKIKKVRYKL